MRGRVTGLQEPLIFEGSSVDELEAAFKNAVSRYHERIRSGNETCKLELKVPCDLLRKMAAASELEDSDINGWLVKQLETHFKPYNEEGEEEGEDEQEHSADNSSFKEANSGRQGDSSREGEEKEEEERAATGSSARPEERTEEQSTERRPGKVRAAKRPEGPHTVNIDEVREVFGGK